jgi:hypothetical protein
MSSVVHDQVMDSRCACQQHPAQRIFCPQCIGQEDDMQTVQSECLAVSPRSISSYAWKVPPMRPALFDQGQAVPAASGGQPAREAVQPNHPSIPWKAYLASREFQHVSSDLAEALFTVPCPDPVPGAIRPASFTLSGAALAAKDGKALRGLLAPVLPGRAADSQTPQQAGQPDDLALAA